jgi:hypothetical protein
VIFCKKIETALKGYSGAWGKLIHEKPEVENLVALSLYYGSMVKGLTKFMYRKSVPR